MIGGLPQRWRRVGAWLAWLGALGLAAWTGAPVTAVGAALVGLAAGWRRPSAGITAVQLHDRLQLTLTARGPWPLAALGLHGLLAVLELGALPAYTPFGASAWATPAACTAFGAVIYASLVWDRLFDARPHTFVELTADRLSLRTGGLFGRRSACALAGLGAVTITADGLILRLEGEPWRLAMGTEDARRLEGWITDARARAIPPPPPPVELDALLRRADHEGETLTIGSSADQIAPGIARFGVACALLAAAGAWLPSFEEPIYARHPALLLLLLLRVLALYAAPFALLLAALTLPVTLRERWGRRRDLRVCEPTTLRLTDDRLSVTSGGATRSWALAALGPPCRVHADVLFTADEQEIRLRTWDGAQAGAIERWLADARTRARPALPPPPPALDALTVHARGSVRTAGEGSEPC